MIMEQKSTALELLYNLLVIERLLDIIHSVYKNEVPPWFAVQMGSVAESVATNLRTFI